MTYTTAHVRMPESIVVRLKNCSWKIAAQVTTTDADVGVIACQGGNMSGWSMWLNDGVPSFTYNCYDMRLRRWPETPSKQGIT